MIFRKIESAARSAITSVAVPETRSWLGSEGVCSRANCAEGVCASVGKQAIRSNPAAAMKMKHFRINPCLVFQRGVESQRNQPATDVPGRLS